MIINFELGNCSFLFSYSMITYIKIEAGRCYDLPLIPSILYDVIGKKIILKGGIYLILSETLS